MSQSDRVLSSVPSLGRQVAALLITCTLFLGGCTWMPLHDSAFPERSPLLPLPEGAGQVATAGSADVQAQGPQLEVTPAYLAFGTEKRELHFTVKNPGNGVLHWTLDVEARSPWLTVVPILGSLEPGESSLVTVTVDRTQLTRSFHMDRICLISHGGYANAHAYTTVPVSVETEAVYAGPIQLALWIEDIDGHTVTIGGAVESSEGTITRMRWLWGDGEVTYVDGPFSPFTITHEYPGCGYYPVRVTAYSANGRERTKTFQIQLGSANRDVNLSGTWQGTMSHDYYGGQ